MRICQLMMLFLGEISLLSWIEERFEKDKKCSPAVLPLHLPSFSFHPRNSKIIK